MCQLLSIIKDYFQSTPSNTTTAYRQTKPASIKKFLVDLSPLSDFEVDCQKLNIVLNNLLKRKLEGEIFILWTHEQKPETDVKLDYSLTNINTGYDFIFKNGKEKF